MAAPVVAIVGATGYVGKLVMPWLLDAVEKGRIKEVRVLSRRPAQVKGAKTYVVNYDDEKSLDEALSGANVVLSIFPGASISPLSPPPSLPLRSGFRGLY
jgi:uncharacterized protein YbjT (DUF2867 family)